MPLNYCSFTDEHKNRREQQLMIILTLHQKTSAPLLLRPSMPVWIHFSSEFEYVCSLPKWWFACSPCLWFIAKFELYLCDFFSKDGWLDFWRTWRGNESIHNRCNKTSFAFGKKKTVQFSCRHGVVSLVADKKDMCHVSPQWRVAFWL